MPVDALGVVVDHDTGENGSEEGGDGGEFGGGVGEIFEGKIWKEGVGGKDEGNWGDESEGEDFAGEPRGFETKEETPGFEGFSEVEGGGDHAGVENEGSSDGCRCTIEKRCC